jgi:hypothetical protein
LNGFCVVVFALALCASEGQVGGKVIDAAGNPIPQAHVFLEPGLAGALAHTVTNEDGRFVFQEVASGPTGFFAVADGHAFGGEHRILPVMASIDDVTLQLLDAGSVSGKVVNHKGKPVPEARIVRAAIETGSKVSIPFDKLEDYGYSVLVSDEEGGFRIDQLPGSGTVTLKAEAVGYAQGVATDVAVGTDRAVIELNPGVIVRGKVVLKDTRQAVANALILFRNMQPPYSTALTKTGMGGGFTLRLVPGVYQYRAAAATHSSFGWQRAVITGERPSEEVTLAVMGLGHIRGTVKDAVSGKPVEKARLVLRSGGNLSDSAYTGASGSFEFFAPEGRNVVTLESAPGHLLPKESAVVAEMTGDSVLELPTFWVTPTPTYHLQVLDPEGDPAPGAAVALLRPAQIGLRLADSAGRVVIDVVESPPDGVLVGMAQHVHKPLGALFALRRDEAADACVQLLPLASVHGRVHAADGKPLEGALVGGLFSTDSVGEPLLLWRTVSRKDGSFEWHGVVPHVAMRCVAYGSDGGMGESPVFRGEAEAPEDLGVITTQAQQGAKSLAGESLEWRRRPVLHGTAPSKAERRDRPAVVLYCESAEVDMAIDAMTKARSAAGTDELMWAVVVNGSCPGCEAPFPILQGAAPGTARTYMTGSDDKVVLETFGLPPLWGIQTLIAQP